MKYLLDTSVINFTEIEIKIVVGKLTEASTIQLTITKHELPILSLKSEHILYFRNLPLLHRDPCEKII